MPARQAFARARCVVMPSRAEAMPYIVLEALGAGMPIIASKVGGIPEIFNGSDAELISSDAVSLEGAMKAFLQDPNEFSKTMPTVDGLKSRFSVETMGDAVLNVYQKALYR